MTHKVKLGDLIDDRFQQAVTILMSKELDVVLSFKLAASLKKLKEYRNQWTAERMRLLDKYAKKAKDGSIQVSEDGAEFVFTKANREKFDTEYAQLIGIEVEVEPIQLNLLHDVRISAETLSELVGKVIVA